MIVLVGFVEFFLYLALVGLSFLYSESLIMMVSGGALAINLISNITYLIIYKKSICKDQEFKYWKIRYKHTVRVIVLFSTIINFKVSRLFYSRFFGLDNFWAAFERKKTLIRPLNCFTYINIVFTMIPVLGISALAFTQMSWGTQLYITVIEAVIIELLMIILTLLEFWTSKKYREKGYEKIMSPKKTEISIDTEEEVEEEE
jgi:hypothetical protein